MTKLHTAFIHDPQSNNNIFLPRFSSNSMNASEMFSIY